MGRYELVGRMISFKDVHVLILSICEYIMVHGKGGLRLEFRLLTN